MISTKQISIKHKKKNVKLFPIYKALSWDLLFYFPIIFLFLTQVKGFSPASVLLADAFYTLSNTFWQLPVTRLVDRIGKKNSLIIGNLLYAFSILAMIFLNSYYELLIIQFIYALGYSIKGICETNILYDSLPVHKKKGNLFSKIDGKSTSYFYIFDAIAAIIAGVAFVLNGYIPMILCFICCIICTILSFKFRHTVTVEERINPVKLKEYSKQIKDAFKFFIKSKRIKSLILFNALFVGIMYTLVNMRSSMLTEMKVPEFYYGIIFAILQFTAAITSRRANNIQSSLKNKTLTYMILPITISCIVIGFIGKDAFSNSLLVLIFFLFLIQYAIKGPYHVLINRYIGNFTNSQIRPKLSALKNLSSNLFAAITSLLCSALLGITTTANTFIIIGCITTVLAILLLDYMKDKVGLKPENYSKEDLKYSIRRPEKTTEKLKKELEIKK